MTGQVIAHICTSLFFVSQHGLGNSFFRLSDINSTDRHCRAIYQVLFMSASLPCYRRPYVADAASMLQLSLRVL